MSLSITCPRCHANLKADKLPSEPKNVECPECGHAFQVTPAGITADLPRSYRAAAASQSMDVPSVARPVRNQGWIAAGVIAAILLAGGGIIAAIVFTRPTPTLEPRVVEVVVQKPTPPVADKDPEDNKRRDQFIRLMIEAGTSFNAQSYDDALIAYAEAAKLFPDDDDARHKLTETQTALAKARQARETQQKTRADALQLVSQGQEALTQKKYPAAVEFFKIALQKDAASSDASTGLLAAQDGLNREQLDQKKLAEYENFIGSGKAALKAGRYADAIREFIAAQRVVPDDAIAMQFQREAEKQLDGLQNRQERQKEFQRLVDLGNTALRTQKFVEAQKTFERALALFPTNDGAQKGLAEAQKAVKQTDAEVAVWMLRGNAAFQGGRFAEAALAFREATRLQPENEGAAKGLRQSELLQLAQDTYLRAMDRGATSLSLKQYGDAIIAYNEALRAVPGDLAAAQGLHDAGRLFEADAGKRKEFERRATIGLQHLKAQRYSDAIAEFEPRCVSCRIIRRPRSSNGSCAMPTRCPTALNRSNARRFQDAARHFQAALREYPNDFAARNGLNKARTGAKA